MSQENEAEFCDSIKPGRRNRTIFGCIKPAGHTGLHVNGRNEGWLRKQEATAKPDPSMTPIPPIPDFCKHGRTEPSCLECKEETIAKLTAANEELQAENTRLKEDLAAWKRGASAMTGFATRTPLVCSHYITDGVCAYCGYKPSRTPPQEGQ